MLRTALRRLTVAAAVGAALCAAAPATAHASATGRADVWTERAVDAYDALQRHLYQGAEQHGLYAERTPAQPEDREHSYVWPMREAAGATVDMSQLPHGGTRYRDDAEERFETLELYHSDGDGLPGYQSYLPAPLGDGGDLYFDDNAVVGLSQMDQYQETGDERYLELARASYEVVTRAWNTDPNQICPGGLDWNESPANDTRGANVTGLSALLAAELYEVTGEDGLLANAETWYAWNRECLRQEPGLYWNSRHDDGRLDTTLWTYNSGSMIGAATALHRATGDQTYLDLAVEDADASLAYWSQGDRLHQQPAIFNAFYFDDLLTLDAVAPNPAYREAMAAYAESTWHSNRDEATGLFRFQPHGGGDYDPDAPAETLEQSAMVQIFATLARH